MCRARVTVVNPTPKQIKERNMKKTTVFSLVLFLVVCALSNAALAQKATVLRVIRVKTDNVAAYVAEIEKGRQLQKSLGSSAQIRVWQARFAGPDAGAVVVSIEYPSMAAYVADEAKVDASAEYQTWLKGLNKIRTIVSDSLYNEW
jgi:hypothetical protein